MSRARLLVVALVVLAFVVFLAAGGPRYFTFENLKAQQAALEEWRALHPGQALAAFFDFGTVTRDSLGPETFSSLQWALGIGLRYLTPVGPIRVDIAYRLPFGRPPPLFDEQGREITYRRIGETGVEFGTETGANINKTCFGIGGSNPNTWVRDGLCVFHISIGEAF